MKKFTTLIVDDEKDFLETLSERFRLRGIPTKTALDGESALNLIEENPPKIVILDVMMPGMGGLEILQRIKEQHPQITVILLTGRGSTKDGIKGMQLGAADYLMKPIDIEELITKMNESVNRLYKIE
ncbi:MAG: response regulator [Deltaproteobacteria bacterium]|jgi:two-component system, OmpR family, response regulator|nr:response regulator [Deltaproteobacteria bacterium]MBT4265330.1 response regulator [Deltaproteobacteria bacterium]MBT4643990.1 response regulator [Deltaproteobacteria bacterium]MBT6614999.1 response regulator [Deltaproteobacteria bacterium]MBT7888826.1 response regulator [Deltaproteobacteria bacterium]